MSDYYPSVREISEDIRKARERGLERAESLSVHGYHYGSSFEFDLEEKARQLEEPQ
jgi:hypothetical protein